jgi:hypothetical protein
MAEIERLFFGLKNSPSYRQGVPSRFSNPDLLI